MADKKLKKKAPAKAAASAKVKPAKKTPAKKAAPGKAPAKKAPLKKVKVTPAKKVAPKKPAPKAPVAKAVAVKGPVGMKAAIKPAVKPTPIAKAPSKPAKPAVRMGKKDLEFFRKLLLNLRDQVVDEISFLAGNNLNREHVASSSEDGTDNFERELALKLVGTEQDIVYEIDEALGRINNGTYGICELSGELIEPERLKVLPHARFCVKVQSEIEKGRTRYRPFGPTLSRSVSE